MNILTLLNSPAPVAWFQHLCGVRWKDSKNGLYPPSKSDTELSEKNSSVNAKPGFLITNQLLFFLARAGTELAGEPFYYVFFPACSWIFHVIIARRTLLMLTCSMFVGQCLKDIIQQPRPASPPVIRLESMYETEYGMPSTHVAAAVASSFSLLVFSSEIYRVPWNTGLLIACLWSSCVIISRIYLGMHTILEVSAGTALSLSIVFFSKPALVWFEQRHLTTGHLSSLCLGIGAMLMARFMFSLDSGVDPTTGKPRWNTARGDLAEILGWCAGFLIGTKYAIDYGILTPIPGSGEVSLDFGGNGYAAVLRCSVRFASGAVILLPVNILTRKGLFHFFAYARGFKDKSPDVIKRCRKVELPYKFLSSGISALVSTLVVPSVLQSLNLW